MSMICRINIGCGAQNSLSLALSRFATKRVYDDDDVDDGVLHVSSAHCTLRLLVSRPLAGEN